jgi:hypothetical protein
MVTYDAGLMFNVLRLDANGFLWVIQEELDGLPFSIEGLLAKKDWEPFPFSGVMCLDSAAGSLAVHFTRGSIDGIRKGWREVWYTSHRVPEKADPVSVAVCASLHTDEPSRDERHGQIAPFVMLPLVGLPPAPDELEWVIALSGDLTLLPRGVVARTDIGSTGSLHISALHLPPPGDSSHSFDGVIFLTERVGPYPPQAMSFIRGHRQWAVRLDADGIAHAPDTLGEAWPERAGMDQRQAALSRACRILPSDYSDYGGSVVRWERGDTDYPDCSSGCRHWNPLHDPVDGSTASREIGGEDADWGVCSNPRSKRCGMLTWEHQHGIECFEPTPERIFA